MFLLISHSVRHIIQRTRDFLENEINPKTQEPYLKPIKVLLLGEEDSDAIRLPSYLGDAYIFTKENVFEIINLQPLKDGKAKPYQVKQVRKLFLEYKFHLNEEDYER